MKRFVIIRKVLNYINLESELDEIKSIYPQPTGCSYAESIVFIDTEATDETIGVAVFSGNIDKLKKGDRDKITKWLMTRQKTDRIKVYFEKSMF
jgi:hypothetical protein